MENYTMLTRITPQKNGVIPPEVFNLYMDTASNFYVMKEIDISILTKNQI
jgi:hypothetical protein